MTSISIKIWTAADPKLEAVAIPTAMGNRVSVPNQLKFRLERLQMPSKRHSNRPQVGDV